MEIKSDIICKGNTWYRINQGYVNKFFKTMWGLFKTCLSIGILYDQQIDDENDSEEDDKLNIPRTMFNRFGSEMQFFYQSAVLSSKCIDLSEKDRLYLAFQSEMKEDDMEDEDVNILSRGVSQQAITFDEVAFLKKFANFGATKLLECLSGNDSETMENLAEFLNKSYNGETDELIKMQEIEDLIDDII